MRGKPRTLEATILKTMGREERMVGGRGGWDEAKARSLYLRNFAVWRERLNYINGLRRVLDQAIEHFIDELERSFGARHHPRTHDASSVVLECVCDRPATPARPAAHFCTFLPFSDLLSHKHAYETSRGDCFLYTAAAVRDAWSVWARGARF